MVKWLFLLLIICFLSSQSKIKLGFIGPLSGPASSYGVMAQRVVSMAVEDINKKNKIQLEVLYEDGRCSGRDAVNAFKKLSQINKVKVVIGGICSSETLAIAPLADKNKVIVFSPMSGSHEITHAGDYVFRNAPSNTDAVKAIFDLITKLCAKKVAIVSEKTDFAVSVREQLLKMLSEYKGKYEILTEDFMPNEKDFKSLLPKLVNFAPNVIVLSAQSAQTGSLFLKQLRMSGLDNLVVTPYLGSEKSFRDSAKGYLSRFISIDLKGLLDDPGDDVRNFFARYKDRYREEITFPFDAIQVYDAVQILADAIEKVSCHPERIKEYLYNLKQFNGLLRAYSFDQNGDVQGIEHDYYEIDNDNLELIKANVTVYSMC